ncbi:TIGR00730 family Rossman fold protein [Micromonospora parva]|uniref:TIGR00730 family Rossman fold protein n=1 Tax=Micromonospora parva TaxID=1464048 RepID=UPI0037B12E97
MRICVFLSATNTDESYAGSVRELGNLISGHGHDLVWGGSEAGLMRILADAVQESGGRLIGISVESLRWVLREKLNEGDEVIVTADLAARKALLLERSDAVLVLPGGTGTLDEATDVIELKRHRVHDKPIVIINIAGFYDGLLQQLTRMEEDGFFDLPVSQLVQFAPDPSTAMTLVEAAIADRAGADASHPERSCPRG